MVHGTSVHMKTSDNYNDITTDFTVREYQDFVKWKIT